MEDQLALEEVVLVRGEVPLVQDLQQLLDQEADEEAVDLLAVEQQDPDVVAVEVDPEENHQRPLDLDQGDNRVVVADAQQDLS